MRSERLLISAVLFLMLWSGCDLINPEEQLPSIVEVTGIELETQVNEGSSNHKITEVWVFDSTKFLGVYPVQTVIPILTGKASTLFRFYPGIRNNGVLDDAIIYPMYTYHEQRLPTTPGASSVVNPVFRYKNEVQFSLLEDFESQNEFSVNLDTNVFTALIRSTSEPFEGAFSGEVTLTADGNFIEVTHAVSLTDLPTDGTPTYLEFQYQTDVPLEVGLLGIPLNGMSFKNYFYQAKPTETWNMLYLELGQLLKESGLPAYKVLFRAMYPPNSTASELKIKLDNIKVVHLQE